MNDTTPRPEHYPFVLGLVTGTLVGAGLAAWLAPRASEKYRRASTRVAEVGAARIVAAFPLYGYRWRRSAETEIISYDEARRLTTMTNTSLSRDHASVTLHAISPEGWEIWVTDRALLATLVREARQLGVSTFALWRLGLEDAGVWDLIGR